MTIYVRRNGIFVNKITGEPMEMPERAEVCAPRVMSDIAEYRSPIDGKLIGSRSTRRYDLAKNDCVEAEPFKRKHPEEYREQKAREAKVMEARRAADRAVAR